MKSIALVTESYNNSLGAFLQENLAEVLSGFAQIRMYFLDRLPGDAVIAEDAVLVMTKEMAINVKNRLRDHRRIIVIQRTIKKSEVYRICSIPPATRVLVVNDNAETTIEMVSLLYQLGIDSLDLIPFDPKRDYPDIKIAITPGERIFVPKHIGNVIDTGHRFIDISTFIGLMDMLGIADGKVSERLFKYMEDLIPLESGLNNQYRTLYVKNLELDSILNLSHEGVLLVDNEGVVRLQSKALSAMLDIGTDIVGKRLADHIQDSLFSLLMQQCLNNELVQYKEHSFLVTSRVMEQFGEKSGTYFNFRDVTYIRQLEQNLNDRLQTRGFVPKYTFDDIKTVSPAMTKCIGLARKFAQSDLPVLVSGESGTGKELIAHSIHSASGRANRPFVAFNCAAVTESLIESELFGYEGGAFTGALKGGKIGLFERANNGTIFLDEIGDMPYVLQSKLLRVLQERQLMRVGSQSVVSVNIRVIAATNQDLEQRIRNGQFREDLYYRLNVLPLPVPPLRERKEDILFLLRYFSGPSLGADVRISAEAEDILLRYEWPGNIRELWNVASYAAFLADTAITAEAIPDYIAQRINDFQREYEALAAFCPDFSAIETLKAISDAKRVGGGGKGAGRASLKSFLEGRGLVLPEGRIRRLLSFLNERGMVESVPGRGGSRITAKGLAFVNWYQNRKQE